MCCMRFSICPGSVIMREQCCHRPALSGLAAKEQKPLRLCYLSDAWTGVIKSLFSSSRSKTQVEID